jgi:hypothetical protein
VNIDLCFGVVVSGGIVLRRFGCRLENFGPGALKPIGRYIHHVRVEL